CRCPRSQSWTRPVCCAGSTSTPTTAPAPRYRRSWPRWPRSDGRTVLPASRGVQARDADLDVAEAHGVEVSAEIVRDAERGRTRVRAVGVGLPRLRSGDHDDVGVAGIQFDD